MVHDSPDTDPRALGLFDIIAIVVVVFTGNLLGAAIVMIWAWQSRTPWSDLGLVRPKNWWVSVAIAIPAGVAFKLVMKAFVMPLLGADPVNATYHYLSGDAGALPAALATMIVGGGFGEELIWRGFLFNRLQRLFGTDTRAKVAIVGMTTVLFSAAHLYDQGIPGAEQALFTGLVFGTVYATTRNIWPVMVAHASFDVAAVLMIYADVERSVAHWIF